MRFIGIALIILSLPFFLGMLGSNEKWRRMAFIGLGLLPIVQNSINLDAAVINWAAWAGQTKGLLITLLDSLALAICMRYGKSKIGSTPLLWLFGFYLAAQIPSLFIGMFSPAFFYFFQFCRVTLYFVAVYLVCRQGHGQRVVAGLAMGIIAHGVVSAYEAATGVGRASGLLINYNLAGFVVNLCVPLFLAYALAGRQSSLFLLATAAGGISAVASGSRAAMVFYGVAVAGTLLFSLLIRPTGRKWAMAGVGALGLAAAVPFAIEKIEGRFRGELSFEADREREAFENAAGLMIQQYPFGVGANQYVLVANREGYLDKAGVTWATGSRATSVHNVYLLTRAETGLIGLIGLLALILVPLVQALRLVFNRMAPDREIAVGTFMALVVMSVHNLYEWISATVIPQYALALHLGLVAAGLHAGRMAVRQRRRRQTREPLSTLLNNQAD